eukprot:6198223-Pleurochrysis_carterae.AAC.1
MGWPGSCVQMWPGSCVQMWPGSCVQMWRIPCFALSCVSARGRSCLRQCGLRAHALLSILGDACTAHCCVSRRRGRKKPMRPPAISRLSSVVRARQRSRPRATKPFPLRLRTAFTNRRRRSRVALALSRGDRLLSAEADSVAMPLALVGDAITSAVRKRAALLRARSESSPHAGG